MKGDRLAVGCAAAAWVGAAVGWVGFSFIGFTAAAAVVVAGLVSKKWLAVGGVILAAATLSGMAAADRQARVLSAPVPEGHVTLTATVLDDQRRGPRTILVVRPTAIGSEPTQVWDGPPLGVTVAGDDPPAVGATIVVEGTLTPRPGFVRGDPVAGRLSATEAIVSIPTSSPLLWAGNAVRTRVRSVLGSSDTDALIAGFLIGDTADVPPADLDALRRSGLTHYVAVSGSNVALFLLGVWMVAGPVASGPRRRALVGLLALAVFVVATRWEPSVLRAGMMAAVLLATAAVGIPVRPWVALGSAVTVLLLLSGQLATDVGFQLSVTATVGVVVGLRTFSGRRPRVFWQVLGAAIGAQAAVAPLLLLHFGSIPLLSPVANLVAAPLVTGATSLGAIAVVTGLAWPADLGRFLANAVLEIAHLAAEWPQLGWTGAGAAVAAGLAARWRRARPIVAVVGLVVVAFPVAAPRRLPDAVIVTILDVGQGDAILIEDPMGAVALVDGGRDPLVLAEALRARRIRRIDLLAVTHGDLDHVGGLEGITDRTEVGTIWHSQRTDSGAALDGLIASASALGIPAYQPDVGDEARLGSVRLEVVGPRRRYLEENDSSIVLWVAGMRTMLLAGDIGSVPQKELPYLRPDVLLVPHHGSGTSDLNWLRATVGDEAVISVGINTYGHPSPEVVDALVGTAVRTTREHGDVVIDLG